MIELTEAGKLWKYPIDNEQDFDEHNVGFHEHVFFDDLLDEGFPKTGPIRHFMELVTVGLSKNPYMSVEKKLEQIQWFREFFEKRQKEIEQYAEQEKAVAKGNSLKEKAAPV